MKMRLTLTINKKALANAKRNSSKTGKSISQIFEEIFKGEETESGKHEPQMAAKRLLNLLKSAIPVKIRHDKQLLKAHVARKFA